VLCFQEASDSAVHGILEVAGYNAKLGWSLNSSNPGL